MTAMRLKRYPSPSGGIALGKMGVGATMLKQGKTARDYVQSGLVAMWDGIENAGWGVHNPSATTWKDLTGNGYDGDSSQYFSRYEWTANSLMRKADYINVGTGQGFDVSQAKSQQLYSAIATSSTIEIVASPTDGVSPLYNWASQVFYIAGISGSNAILGIFLNGTSVGYATKAPNATAAKNITISPALSIADLSHASISMTTDSTSGVCVVRLNNERATNISNTYTDRSENVQYVTIPNAGCGKTHNIRVYSRALTASEIAANYAIDKERFNLP